MKWLTAFFWWVISPFSFSCVIIISKAQGFKSKLKKGSGVIVCVLLLLLITSIIIISPWPWASPTGLSSLLPVTYVCWKLFGADLVVWWSRPTTTGFNSTSRPVGAAVQLLWEGIHCCASLSSWGPTADCCRDKKGLSFSWQDVTGWAGNTSALSQNTTCGHKDTPGELVWEPTGNKGGLAVPPAQF